MQFCRQLFVQDDAPPTSHRIIPRAQHNISRQNINPNALKVLSRLEKAGFEAYLVGGAVRDLLLGLTPKDFDIATNATPDEVKALFSNCRLIGRRFRLAHILFGRDVIEVATFRGAHDADSDDPASQRGKEGMLLRDNVYGSLEDDVQRRDFTINALYYRLKDFTVHDFTGGLEDLATNRLRLIGEPDTRYREDPVRMLRAIRFQVKLNMLWVPETVEPLGRLGSLLEFIPKARLYDESLKLLLSGQAYPTYCALQQAGLLRYLFPQVAELSTPEGNSSAERLIIEHHTDLPKVDALALACNQVLDLQIKSTAIPRYVTNDIREIWSLQSRFLKRQSKVADKLLALPKFRAAYDFLLLRQHQDKQLTELAHWWTQYQTADGAYRQALLKQTAVPASARRRKKRRPSAKLG